MTTQEITDESQGHPFGLVQSDEGREISVEVGQRMAAISADLHSSYDESDGTTLWQVGRTALVSDYNLDWGKYVVHTLGSDEPLAFVEPGSDSTVQQNLRRTVLVLFADRGAHPSSVRTSPRDEDIDPGM